MGIFIRGLGIKQTFRRSNVMFSGNERKFKRKKIAELEEKSLELSASDSRREIETVANGEAAAPNSYPSIRPRHIIHKKTIKAKMLNLKQPTLVAVDKHGLADGNVEPTRYGWKSVPNATPSDRSDVIADDTEFEAGDDKSLLSNIQLSLSSIHLKQSDIQKNLWRMMRTRCSARELPATAMADGDRAREPPLRDDYINEMQHQTADRCQCCYHDENHHYESDSHQLPGKLVNFIVLIAIFLHYAIIAFIEPNYFD